MRGNNNTGLELDGKLRHCGEFFITFYLNASAEGAHFYSNIFYIVVNVLVSFAGLFLNLLVVAVYSRNKLIRTTSNMLLVVLSCSDLMVNSIVQPLMVYRMLKEIFGSHDCLIWTLARMMSYFSCGVSMLTVSIISLERFTTLAFPYHYQNIVTPFRVKVAVVSTWLGVLALVLCHLGLVSHAVLSSIGVALIILSIATVVASWIWIKRLVRRHQKAIKSTQTPALAMSGSTSQQEFRSTNTCCLIASAVVCFYSPSLALLSYLLIHKDSFLVLFLIEPWVETVMFANSVVNPILLFWRKKTYRATAKQLLS